MRDIQLAQVEQWATSAFCLESESAAGAITKTDSQLVVRLLDVRSRDPLHVQVQRSSDF